MTMQRMLRDHYESKTLRPEARARIANLVPEQNDRGRWVRAVIPFAMAATVVLAALLGVFAQSPAAKLGAEIAHNHARGLEPEFETASYEELTERMHRLDFAVRAPNRLAARGFRLVGARYCSLDGRIAAQLRLVDARDETLTLYLVRSGHRMEAARRRHSGVAVELWQEGELTYGLAQGNEGKR